MTSEILLRMYFFIANPQRQIKLAACLIIIFRYRNNYFHGIKWATEFRDQQKNFEESNKLLAFVLDQLNDG